MSHYPSSAELAAFRRSYGYTLDCLAHVTDYERANGIGYRLTPLSWHRVPADPPNGPIACRREASALRSRAYARVNPYPVDVDTDGNGVWTDGIETWNSGEPLTDAERGELPTYIVPDYWDDDSPRSPLPIAYRNPVTILADAR